MSQLELLKDIKHSIESENDDLFFKSLESLQMIDSRLPELNFTSLEYAVRYNRLEYVRKLLDLGANPNRKSALMGLKDNKGEPPLMVAIIHKYEKIAHLLLDRGAKPDYLWISLYKLHQDDDERKFFENISLRMIELGGRVGGNKTTDYGLYKAIICDKVAIFDALLSKQYVPGLYNMPPPKKIEVSKNEQLEKMRMDNGILKSKNDDFHAWVGVSLKDYENYIWMDGKANLEERYHIPNFKGRAYYGTSLVHQAVLHNARKILDYLDDRDMRFNLHDSDSLTPHDYAVIRNDVPMQEYISSIIERRILEQDNVERIGKIGGGKIRL